jgi:hypothetical protein
MTVTNDFLPLATGGGSNVESQATWLTDSVRLTGFQNGTADATIFNKAFRQATSVASMVGQFVTTKGGVNAVDDGNITNLMNAFIAGLAGTFPVYFGIDTGTLNAYVVSPSPALSVAPTFGTTLILQAKSSNTMSSTLTVSGFGPTQILTTSGSPIIQNSILNNGIYVLVNDGTHWQLVSGTGLNLIPSGNTMLLPAGSAAVNQNDLVEISSNTNEAYSAKTIDYAVTGGDILPTQIPFGFTAFAGYARNNIVRDTDGNIYTASADGGLSIQCLSPIGVTFTPLVIDAAASFSPRIVVLTNNTFAVVYWKSAGLYFSIFDSSLTIISGPTSAALEYAPSSVTRHEAIALSGGGLAIVYQDQTTGKVQLATYSNAGAAVLATTSVINYTGTLAQASIKIGQLANGNLVIASRGTMAPAGTVFVIVNISGVNQAGPTTVDAVSTLGFVELSVLPSGVFAISDANGTNLVWAVYSQAGAIQGSAGSKAYTINVTTCIQTKAINDAVGFWIFYAGNTGIISVVNVSATGVLLNSAAPFTLSSGTYSIDAAVSNGTLVVLCCSITTLGQSLTTLYMPDSSIGVNSVSIKSGPSPIGIAAGTTGTFWPKLLPLGEWVVAALYDQQTVNGLFLIIDRLEQAQIMGVALTSVAAGLPGTLVTVDTAPGSFPINALVGTPGQTFNQGTGLPIGNAGILYSNGVVLNGIPSQLAAATPINLQFSGVFGAGKFKSFVTPNTYSWVVPNGVNKIRVRVVGGGQSGITSGATAANGGTSSFGALLSATGGTSVVGAGVGGQFQASGGPRGLGGTTGSIANGGGGGGASGSLYGTGGAGGNGGSTSTSAWLAGGGAGGGVGGGLGANGVSAANPGISGTIVSSGGGGTGTNAIGATGGANANGIASQSIQGTGVPNNPANFSSRFPFDALGGGGGSGGPINTLGSPGGEGGGGSGEMGTMPGGTGGTGGGGGAGSLLGTLSGSTGGAGAGGGGLNASGGSTAGGNGGTGGGYAEGVFIVVPGITFTVTVGAGGVFTPPGTSIGGDGRVIVEW